LVSTTGYFYRCQDAVLVYHIFQHLSSRWDAIHPPLLQAGEDVTRTHYFPVLIGAINIGTLIGGIFIFPISLIYILVAFSFVTYIAGFLLCLWGIFLPVIIILNFIISSFLFLFEKIKEMFTKEKKEISAL